MGAQGVHRMVEVLLLLPKVRALSQRSIQVAANYEVGHLRMVELRGSHMNILRMYASCGNTRAKLQVVRRGLSEGAKGSQGAKGFAPLGSIGLTSTIPGRPIGSTRVLSKQGIDCGCLLLAALGSQPGCEPGGICESIGSGWICNMFTPVGNRTFPSNQRLHVHAKHGEHRQPTVLDLLQLQLGQGSGVLTEA